MDGGNEARVHAQVGDSRGKAHPGQGEAGCKPGRQVPLPQVGQQAVHVSSALKALPIKDQV